MESLELYEAGLQEAAAETDDASAEAAVDRSHARLRKVMEAA